MIRGVIDRARIVFGHDDGRAPVVSVLHLPTLKRRRHDRIRGHVTGRLRLVVEFRDDPHVATGVDEARVIAIERGLRTLATADRVPILPAHTTGSATRDRHRGVVLLATVHVVWEPIVRVDAIELGRRLILLGGPRPTAVERDVRPSVIGVDHDVTVGRIDPEVVCVPVRHADVGERPSTVDGPHHGGVQDVDGLRIGGVGEDLDVVPGPRTNRPTVAHERPRSARVVRAEETAARIGLDHGEEPVGIRS